jgi:hypothetical protein
MSTIQQHTSQQQWSRLQIILFRIVFVFLLLLTIPLDWGYYKRLFGINLFHLHFQDIFQLTNYVPRLVHFSDWGIASYAGWGIALLVAIILAFVWDTAEKNDHPDYDQLYYRLRVIVRYRLAIGLIGYGVIKLFPVQIPYPALSDLQTAYGDFLPWKIYYLSTGVATAHYEQTLGAIEILAGLLLLCRRTAAIGAVIAIAFLTNIVLANFAYQLGDHVYSVYLLILAVFILAYDGPRLYNLLVKEKLAIADGFKPIFKYKNTAKIRLGLKIFIVLFIVFYASLTYAGYSNSNWPYPDTPGLPNAYGVYNVRQFKINNTILPYSATDSTRWQDVVFEKWNVLSIRGNKHVPIDYSSPDFDYQADGQRDYESKGNAGRAFYSYQVSDSTIRLTNKNVPSDIEVFKISRPDKSTIILNGTDSRHDSLYVVLDKQNKQYLLDKGRRKPVSIY